MEEKIFRLIDEAGSDQPDRRKFLKKLALITGSTAAALTILPVLTDETLTAAAKKQKVVQILEEMITYPVETGAMKAFMARPSKGKKFPAVNYCLHCSIRGGDSNPRPV